MPILTYTCVHSNNNRHALLYNDNRHALLYNDNRHALLYEWLLYVFVGYGAWWSFVGNRHRGIVISS